MVYACLDIWVHNDVEEHAHPTLGRYALYLVVQHLLVLALGGGFNILQIVLSFELQVAGASICGSCVFTRPSMIPFHG